MVSLVRVCGPSLASLVPRPALPGLLGPVRGMGGCVHLSLSAGVRTSHASVLPTSRSLLGTRVRHLLPWLSLCLLLAGFSFRVQCWYRELALPPLILNL